MDTTASRLDLPAGATRALRLVLSIPLMMGAALLLPSGAIAQGIAPPPITILQDSGSLAPGFIFVGPQGISAGPNPVEGPEIIDNLGRPVWFLQTPGKMATDFRVQTYKGNQVLTWAQGVGSGDTNPGDTTDYIMDSSYTVIATVQAGNGYDADIHEFQLTPQNTALITIYNVVPTDLSSVGGPVNGSVLEGVVQEIDVASGNVLFEWHSLPHVPVTESHYPYSPSVPGAYDYFHINSAKLDTDGNLLISSRHTWTVYKVNRSTGAVMWRLGGKSSDFALGPGLPFAWQHDVEAVDSQTLRIFDNESDGTPVLPYSRVLWVQHDDAAMTASIVQSVVHPDQLSVAAEGSAQTLSNGDTLVEWGFLGRISEFNPSGQLLFDAAESPGYASYRGYRFAWSGTPTTLPTATAFQGAGTSLVVHAIWNGATQVATWVVYGAGPDGTMNQVASAPWNGLDTLVTVPGSYGAVQVVALDGSGNTLATSAAVSGPFPDQFLSQPASQIVAAGGSFALSAPAAGSATTYQWQFAGATLTDGTVAGTTTSGSTQATLLVTGATTANAGSYTCIATNQGAAVASNPASITVVSTADPGRLVNVSSRGQVGTGANQLILGYVVGGQGTTGSESLLLRASGPALTQFGLSGVLPDPELTLIGSNGVIATNGAWGGDAGVAAMSAQVGAFAWTDASSLDSALSETLAVGSYMVQVTGASGDTGLALAEVYDSTPAGGYTPATPRLINVSAREFVGAGGNSLIAGFVIGGSTAETVLIRASGPALASLGLAGTLTDPQLQLFKSNPDGSSTLLQSNTGWGGDPQIALTANLVGAFTWGDTATADSALLVTLPPGTYTAQLAGASGDTGLGLVEVYEVQ